MASGRCVGHRPDGHTFLCKFWHFQMAVSQRKLAWLTPNLGILWISVCSFWLRESIVANPIIYRLVPRPSRFETRQCMFIMGSVRKIRLGEDDKILRNCWVKCKETLRIFLSRYTARRVRVYCTDNSMVLNSGTSDLMTAPLIVLFW